MKIKKQKCWTHRPSELTSKNQPQPEALMFGGGSGYAADGISQASGGVLYWPSLDPRFDAPMGTQESLWRKACALEANSGIAGKAIDEVEALMGWMVPHASSGDEAWNEEADELFLARSLNPDLFDVAGNLNFYSAQLWIERNRALYGDNLTVLANALDEGACFGFYRAPQIKSAEGEGWSSGVKTDRHGKAVAYSLSDYTNPGQFVEIRREDAILYRHNPDARGLRGVTDLRRAIRHIHDEAEIVAFSKQSAKLAATIGIIETKNVEDKRPGMGAGLVGKTEITDDGRKVEAVIGGTKVVRLDPGRDLKILNDPRPSPNVMALVRHLMDEVAYGIGLTPSILWDPDKVGSAGIRYVMQRLKRWLKLKYVYRQQWCNRVWRYTIAKEIKLGRLRRPSDDKWMNVFWAPLPDLTIDVGREGQLMIDLVDAGLGDQDDWCLRNYGVTYKTIIRNKVRNTVLLHDLCKKYGLDPNLVVPGRNRGGVALPVETDEGITAPTPQDIEPEG